MRLQRSATEQPTACATSSIFSRRKSRKLSTKSPSTKLRHGAVLRSFENARQLRYTNTHAYAHD